MVLAESVSPRGAVNRWGQSKSVQSIMGATEKRRDTVAGVVAGFKPCSMGVSGVRVSGVFPGVCGRF